MNILSRFLGGLDLAGIIQLACAVILSLSMHELLHGIVAYKLGDPTAKNAGRLTLNPLAHIDPLGMVCMLLFGFGWAKPVPVNPRWFRKPRAGMALVAAAGPASNLLLGFVSIFIWYLIMIHSAQGAFAMAAADFMVTLASINVGFAVFNLLPLPPLDGSRILGLFLPERWQYTLIRYERYIQIAVMIALYLGVLTRPLSAARSAVFYGMEAVIRWILL